MLMTLIALFVVIPWLELTLLLLVGHRIGVLPTLGIIILTGVSGAWLARSQGVRAWRRVHEALASGRVPAGELVEGLLVLIAGVLLLTPGFFTDTVGFALLVPVIRAGAATLLLSHFSRRVSCRTYRMDPGPEPDENYRDPDTIEGRALRVEDAEDE